MHIVPSPKRVTFLIGAVAAISMLLATVALAGASTARDATASPKTTGQGAAPAATCIQQLPHGYVVSLLAVVAGDTAQLSFRVLLDGQPVRDLDVHKGSLGHLVVTTGGRRAAHLHAAGRLRFDLPIGAAGVEAVLYVAHAGQVRVGGFVLDPVFGSCAAKAAPADPGGGVLLL